MALASRPETRLSHTLWPFPEWSDWLAPLDLLLKDGTVKTLRAEEYREGDMLVVRVEIPGVDPEKDIEVQLVDGTLCINAERHTKVEEKDKQGYRTEMSYGSFARTIPLPSGTDDKDIHATYRDGILEVRVPMMTQEKPRREGKSIPVKK